MAGGWMLVLFLSVYTTNSAGGITTVAFATSKACQRALRTVQEMPTFRDAICINQQTGEQK